MSDMITRCSWSLATRRYIYLSVGMLPPLCRKLPALPSVLVDVLGARRTISPGTCFASLNVVTQSAMENNFQPPMWHRKSRGTVDMLDGSEEEDNGVIPGKVRVGRMSLVFTRFQSLRIKSYLKASTY